VPVLGTTAFSAAGDVFSLVRSLLNDADIPSVLTITPAGAVRSGNLVTITTSAPHGLQIGMIVQVASVSDTSFNGTQTVVSVPTSTTFTYNQAAANANSGNGTVAILIQGDWATDAVLVPLANAAYRKLQRRMWMAGSKTTTNEVLLQLPANFTQLSDGSIPQMPVDFLAPRELWERIQGSGTGLVGFVPMKPVDALPNVPVAGYNGVFTWYDETLNFLGSTSALDLRLRYFVGFPAISDASSVITVRGGADPSLPVGGPEGASDEESSYLHIIVCYAEWQKMKVIVGAGRAHQIMEFWARDHYRAIYRLVLDNEAAVGDVVNRHRLRPR